MNTIKEMTTESLKALAYDHLANIENSQAVIRAVNKELANRVPPTEASVDPKTVPESEVVEEVK